MSPSTTCHQKPNFDMGAHFSAVPEFQGSMEQLKAMEQIDSEFKVTTNHMQAIVDQFVQEMHKGLDHHGATGM
ncbi:hypothetical protein [Absidia glauca]|uniref:Uncharacterized protein n=1 Tax=Absidia glauca TaxID=4829 RepID=A0A168PK79_ABSGL|nr:hypothetical protein [Absidia glauca]